MRPPIFTLLAAMNHLLRQEPWACARLQTYAGKTACLQMPPFTLRLQVAEEGLLQAAPAAEVLPDGDAVTIRLPMGAAMAFLGGGQEAVMRHVRIEGDAEFANTISQLARQVRWEPAEDLSKVVGDPLAHRIVEDTRKLGNGAMQMGQALLGNLTEYLLEERPVLVKQQSQQQFNEDVANLRDDVARLEKRLARLERLGQQTGPSRVGVRD